MAIQYLETDRITTALSDGKDCDIVTYDIYENETLIASQLKESQVKDIEASTPTYLCWQNIRPQREVERSIYPEYIQANENGSLPRPKSTPADTKPNPGGSPVKY